MWHLSYNVNMSPDREMSNDGIDTDIIEKFFYLMETEKSRYELQAIEFLREDFYSHRVSDFIFIYSIQNNLYSCDVLEKATGERCFTIQFPIPRKRERKMSRLIELFAQSEAGVNA